jgi:hypothetical protein
MMHQLDTVLGTEDLYDQLEILIVDSKNRKLLEERSAKETKNA